MHVDLGSRAWASTTLNLRTRPSLVLEKKGSSHKQFGLQIHFSPISSFPVFLLHLPHKPNFSVSKPFLVAFLVFFSLNKHLHSLKATPETQNLTERLHKWAGAGGGCFPASASPSQKSGGFRTQSQRIPEQKGPQVSHLNLPRTLETLPSLYMSKGRGWKADFLKKL